MYRGLSRLVALLSPLVAATTPASPIVDLGYAQYQGSANSCGNIDFLGIRYAAPPVGRLRFREPHPPSPILGVQLANQHPNRCYVAPWGSNPVNPYQDDVTSTRAPRRGRAGQILDNSLASRALSEPRISPLSEDCLFLNVVVPGQKINTDPRLPVVVWIHGGGYMSGSASYPGYGPEVMFDGNDLVHHSKGKAIVVLIQYRLGLFGFLAGDDVKKGGALNAGLLDQEYALQWVQRHIAKFGGDPSRVTIWGESAGAGSVLQQIIANGGKTNPPLFRSAILSSIFLPSQYKYNDGIPTALYNDVVTRAGCSSSSDKLGCLRRAEPEVLDEVNVSIGNNSLAATFAFVPVVDGAFIRQRPRQALQQGKLNTRHVLAVTNTNEGAMFIVPDLVHDVAQYTNQLYPALPHERIESLVELYQGLGSVAEQAGHIHGDSVLICPTYALLRAAKGHGRKGHYAVPPAAHYDDAFYYFPSVSPTGVPVFNNPVFINTFAGSFLDFAVQGTPNVDRAGSILPSWPVLGNNERSEMVFNRTGDTPAIFVESTPSSLLERCRFWDSVSEFTGQ